ncbi:MAG TPA: Nramp family divalent metal transporter [Solirubrobacteraceae bacterium]|jgi:manganese transport protein|nr:Nramp family divalent metal transporter [Solirubrobacteraceae bacterium]
MGLSESAEVALPPAHPAAPVPHGSPRPAGRGAPRALEPILARGRLRAAITLSGPAFVAAVAYVDPGNFATNFQAGAEHGYLLVWVVVMASLMAMLIQYQTAKLGLVTRKSLPELCREVFPRRANVVLWLEAEAIAMATDLAEFTGAAVGLHLVFGIPLFLAGLVTAVVAFAVLALEHWGYRPFELAIFALLMLVALGFIVDFFAVGHQSYSGIANGVVPRLGHGDVVSLAVGIIGATVMPHVIYLHSALQKDRFRSNARGVRKLLAYNKLDCLLGLGLAGVVNVAMLCVAAALFAGIGFSGNVTLSFVHSRLATDIGGGAALAFGGALIASGISASSVGTYSGQVVMSGFMNWKIPLILRRLITMVPSLIVLAVTTNTTHALVLSQIALSFGIPFALVPLLLFTSQRKIMGEYVNARVVTAALFAVTVVITGLNIYLLATAI